MPMAYRARTAAVFFASASLLALVGLAAGSVSCSRRLCIAVVDLEAKAHVGVNRQNFGSFLAGAGSRVPRRLYYFRAGAGGALVREFTRLKAVLITIERNPTPSDRSFPVVFDYQSGEKVEAAWASARDYPLLLHVRVSSALATNRELSLAVNPASPYYQRYNGARFRLLQQAFASVASMLFVLQPAANPDYFERDTNMLILDSL